jgi:predicted house-cleaning noncanonical NTP pyrophosphatase (MazG superfamily)
MELVYMESKKVFTKLVRDRIPEFIECSGYIPEIEVLDDLTYSKMLDAKLIEECNELLATKDINEKIEEIADVVEVLYAMADVLGVTMSEVENVRLNKREKRVAFTKKLFLISATPVTKITG